MGVHLLSRPDMPQRDTSAFCVSPREASTGHFPPIVPPRMLQLGRTKGIQTLRLGTRRKWKSSFIQVPGNQKAHRDRRKIRGISSQSVPRVLLR